MSYLYEEVYDIHTDTVGNWHWIGTGTGHHVLRLKDDELNGRKDRGMRLIDADELITAFPCGESVRTECVRATINNMPTIKVGDKAECDNCIWNVCNYNKIDWDVSEDCISREYILGEAFASDEYNRETKSFDLPVVSVRDIEQAPSVVPSRAEGEWIFQECFDEHYGRAYECGLCGEGVVGKHNYCPNCGAKMRG